MFSFYCTVNLAPPQAETCPYFCDFDDALLIYVCLPQSQISLVLRGCVLILQPLGCHRGATGGALENHQNLNYFYFIFLSTVTG